MRYPAAWLVSYPRSGNTFLRALILNYRSGLDRPLTLAEIAQLGMGEHLEPVWEAVTGQKAADRSLETEWKARAEYYENLIVPRRDGRLPLAKAHTLNADVFDTPAFSFTPQDRIVHLVRHPCDVVLSAADYYDQTIDEAIDRMLKPGLFIDSRPKSGFEVHGSWRQHTESWMKANTAPVHRISYFDLTEEPELTLAGAIGFIGDPLEPARVRKAVEFSAFETLRSDEAASGFSERAETSASGQFFRQGRSFQWLDQLTPDQAERLIAPNQDLLDRLGFTARMAAMQASARR